MRVGHHGEKRPAVMSNSLANGTCELVVPPIAGPGFCIRRKVGRDDAAGKVRVRQNLPCALRARYDGMSRSGPIVMGMAVQTATQSRRDISPAFHPLRRAFKSTASERARFRPEKRTPPDGQSDAN